MDKYRYFFHNKRFFGNPVVKILLSEQCNANCIYCFQQVRKIDNRIIGFELAKKYLRRLENGTTVYFFGGEPFLQIDLMKKLIEWCREYKNFMFGVQTNGFIIDREFLRDYCGDMLIHPSIDGPEHVHDLNRGKGSWKKIMAFYNACIEETGNYPFPTPIVCNNTVGMQFEHVLWAFDTYKKFSIDFHFSNEKNFTEKDIVTFGEQVALIKNWYLKNKIYENKMVSAESFRFFEEKYLTIEERKKLNLNLSPASIRYHKKPFITIDGFFPGEESYVNKILLDKCFRYSEDFEYFDFSTTFNKDNMYPCKECDQARCKIQLERWFDKDTKTFKFDETFCKLNKIIINESIDYIKELKKLL